MKTRWWCLIAFLVGFLAFGVYKYATAVDDAVKAFKADCREINGTVTEETVFRGQVPIYGPNGQITGYSQIYGTHFECAVNGAKISEFDI